MACSECKQRNYDTTKNKKNDPDRLEMNKYCKFCRKHTLHKETEVTRGKKWLISRKRKPRRLKKPTLTSRLPAKKNKPKLTERVARFFREYRSELKKVVWSTPQQTLNNTILVAVSVVITSVCIGILDFAFSTGLTALGRLI